MRTLFIYDKKYSQLHIYINIDGTAVTGGHKPKALYNDVLGHIANVAYSTVSPPVDVLGSGKMRA